MAHRLKTADFSVIEGKASDFLAIGMGGSDNITTNFENGFECVTIEGGQFMICDSCNEYIKKDEICYYVAVLNRILCAKCFKKFILSATYYKEDCFVEMKNYSRIKAELEYEGLWNPDEESEFDS